MKPHGLIYLRHGNILFRNFFLKLLKVQFTPVYGKSTRILVSLKPFDVFTPSLPRNTPLVFAFLDVKYLPRVFRDYACGFLETRQTAAQKKLIPRDNFDKRAKCARQRDFALPTRSLFVPTALCGFIHRGESRPLNRRQLCASAAAAAATFSPFLPASLIKKKNLS